MSDNRVIIGCVLDIFTRECLDYCALCIDLTPENYSECIIFYKPKFILVESAWHGYKGAWEQKISRQSDEIRSLVEFAKELNIPTVFFNKEDPQHYHQFLKTAFLFDYIFTTDINMISKYKKDVGHGRVYILPFAASPKLSNPIITTTVPRKLEAFFAGSYYVRYPDRVMDFNRLISVIESYIPVSIYDRYLNSSDENYKFPENYKDKIVGTLEYQKIHEIYKTYEFGININTIKESKSMFARRVTELLASGTIVVSNFSDALKLLFPNSVILVSDSIDLDDRLKSLVSNSLSRSKIALIGLRTVMLSHLMEYRLNRILEKVFDNKTLTTLPCIYVFNISECFDDVLRVLEMLKLQTHANWKAFIFLNNSSISISSFSNLENIKVKIYLNEDFRKILMKEIGNNHVWISFINKSDYYGPNYLLDLILATKYSDAFAFGKKAYFDLRDTEIALINAQESYRPVESIDMSCSIINSSQISFLTLNIDNFFGIYYGNSISLDPLSYCRNAFVDPTFPVAEISQVVDTADESRDASLLAELYNDADQIKIEVPFWLGTTGLSPSVLFNAFGDRFSNVITGTLDIFGWHLQSLIPDKESIDIFFDKSILCDLIFPHLEGKFYWEVGAGLNLSILLQFEDSSGAYINRENYAINKWFNVNIPANTFFIRFGFHIKGSGSTRITRLVLS